MVQGPTPPMVRPHPAFWRLVHGIMVVYLLFMVYMLMQNVHDARQFLRVRSIAGQTACGCVWGCAQPALQALRLEHRQLWPLHLRTLGCSADCRSCYLITRIEAVIFLPLSAALQHLYPELGVELPERHYGTDCRLWVPGEGINWKVGGRASRLG